MSNYIDTLHKIVAPNLTKAEYGKDIKQQFENIDDNFRRVAHRDFVKGKAGSSVFYADYLLYDESTEQFTSLGNSMLNTITGEDIDWNGTIDWSGYPTLAPVKIDDIKTIYFYDYVKYNPYITVLYTLKDVEAQDTEDNRTLLCSPQVYVFLDNRFSEEGTLTTSNPDQSFTNLIDMSCVLNLKYEEQDDQTIAVFSKSNLFPTLYYDDQEEVFKWRIYGNDSGIRATGPKGSDGKSLSTYIVRNTNYVPADPESSNPDFEGLCQVFEYVEIIDGIYSWEAIDPASNKGPSEGDTVIVSLSYANPDSETSDDYVGDIFISKAHITSTNQCFVALDNQTSLLHATLLTKLTNLLSAINRGGILGGLFVPYNRSTGEVNSSSGAHFLYSSNENSIDEKTLNIKPVDDKSNAYQNPDASNVVRSTPSRLSIQYDNVDIIGVTGTKMTLTDDSIITNSSNLQIVATNEINLCTQEDDGPNKRVTIDNDVTIHNNTTIKGNTVIKGTATAKVNKVDDVYLGCPIGTIVMWAGDEENIPDGWLLCNGSTIGVRRQSEKYTVAYNRNYTKVGSKTFNTNTYKDLQNLVDVIKAEYGVILSEFRDTVIGVSLPNLQQKFPLGAKQGATMSTGYNSANTQTYVYTSIGSTGGTSEVQLSRNTMPEHNHDQYISYSGNLSSLDDGQEQAGGIIVRKTGINTYASRTDTTYIKNTGFGHPHNNMPPFLAINFIIKYR